MTGLTLRAADNANPPWKEQGMVSAKGDRVVVKASPEQGRQKGTAASLLDEYRLQGVDLELSGEEQLTGRFTDEQMEAKPKEEYLAKQEEKALHDMYQQNLESAKESAKAAKKGYEDMGRALEIARRMMKGDIVPRSDEQFLMDYNHDIYMGAKTMQSIAQNEDSKKRDSVLEDDEEESSSVSVKDGAITVDAEGLNLCQELPRS